jgi:hypothetical protein
MLLKTDGVVARVSAALDSDSDALPDAHHWAPDQNLTAPQRRTRLAFRIALLRRNMAATAAIVPDLPPPSELPQMSPGTAADNPPPDASATGPKPRKAKMSTVGLEDAALLLGSIFGQTEEDTAPTEPAGSAGSAMSDKVAENGTPRVNSKKSKANPED